MWGGSVTHTHTHLKIELVAGSPAGCLRDRKAAGLYFYRFEYSHPNVHFHARPCTRARRCICIFGYCFLFSRAGIGIPPLQIWCVCAFRRCSMLRQLTHSLTPAPRASSIVHVRSVVSSTLPHADSVPVRSGSDGASIGAGSGSPSPSPSPSSPSPSPSLPLPLPRVCGRARISIIVLHSEPGKLQRAFPGKCSGQCHTRTEDVGGVGGRPHAASRRQPGRLANKR
jgi:hypothetical protein